MARPHTPSPVRTYRRALAPLGCDHMSLSLPLDLQCRVSCPTLPNAGGFSGLPEEVQGGKLHQVADELPLFSLVVLERGPVEVLEPERETFHPSVSMTAVYPGGMRRAQVDADARAILHNRSNN